MRTHSMSLLAAALAVVVLAACTPLPPASAAAVVGGVDIPRDRITTAVESLDLDGLREGIQVSLPQDLQGTARAEAVEAQFRAAVIDTQRRILDVYVRLELIRRMADDLGAEATDADRTMAREQLLASIGGAEALADVLRDSGLTEAVFEEAIVAQEALVVAMRRTLIAEQSLELRTPRHILVSSEAEALEVLAELQEGADFAELAQERSEDPGSAAQGGDLGPQPRGAWLIEFDDAVWAAEVGELVGPVATQAGFHLIEVVSAERLGPDDLSEQQVQQLTGAELEARFVAVLQDTEVVIDPAFGTWDPDGPAGPTIQPAAPVGRGAARPAGNGGAELTQEELEQLLEQLGDG